MEEIRTTEVNVAYYTSFVLDDDRTLLITTTSVPEDLTLGPRDFGSIVLQCTFPSAHNIRDRADNFKLLQHFVSSELCAGFSVRLNTGEEAFAKITTLMPTHYNHGDYGYLRKKIIRALDDYACTDDKVAFDRAIQVLTDYLESKIK